MVQRAVYGRRTPWALYKAQFVRLSAFCRRRFSELADCNRHRAEEASNPLVLLVVYEQDANL